MTKAPRIDVGEISDVKIGTVADLGPILVKGTDSSVKERTKTESTKKRTKLPNSEEEPCDEKMPPGISEC